MKITSHRSINFDRSIELERVITDVQPFVIGLWTESSKLLFQMELGFIDYILADYSNCNGNHIA